MKRNDKRLDDKKAARPVTRESRPASRSPVGRETGDGTGDPSAPEEIDQVVSMLGEIDIDVETVAEETTLPEEAEKAVEAEWAAEEPPEREEEQAERAPGETADPVRM